MGGDLGLDFVFVITMDDYNTKLTEMDKLSIVAEVFEMDTKDASIMSHKID